MPHAPVLGDLAAPVLAQGRPVPSRETVPKAA
jgi:hypothetical protein